MLRSACRKDQFSTGVFYLDNAAVNGRTGINRYPAAAGEKSHVESRCSDSNCRMGVGRDATAEEQDRLTLALRQVAPAASATRVIWLDKRSPQKFRFPQQRRQQISHQWRCAKMHSMSWAQIRPGQNLELVD